MTVRRLVLTTTAMAALAVLLRGLTGPWDRALATLVDAATVSTTSGPEQVVLAAAGLLAWAAWGWGALGLLLTAASAAPGIAGALARRISRLVLPTGLRTTAGLALGVGLVVAAPAAAAAPAAVPSTASVPDWPVAEPEPTPPALPDWPSASPSDDRYTVAPGDCLWRIAEDRLRELGRHPTDAEVAREVDQWWSANRDVIGADPDLIHPGQVLRLPTGTPAPPSTDLPFRSTR